jgi:hypothetical protein
MSSFRKTVVYYYLITIVLWLAAPDIHVTYLAGYRPLFYNGLLVTWGCIPSCAGILAIMVSTRVQDKVFSWSVFLLGIAGIVLSFAPWSCQLLNSFMR